MKKILPIRTIQKGSGEHSLWFRVGDRYATIREELKAISWGNGNGYEMIVYRCYDKDETLLAEIECNAGLTIFYGDVVEIKDDKILKK